MYSNGIQSYRKTDVITSDPVRLVIMCYEGAVDRLKLAKQKIIEGDYEGKGKDSCSRQGCCRGRRDLFQAVVVVN